MRKSFLTHGYEVVLCEEKKYKTVPSEKETYISGANLLAVSQRTEADEEKEGKSLGSLENFCQSFAAESFRGHILDQPPLDCRLWWRA